jgi:isopentenyl diphosphate isomerase/L-lactate dehydrogenase-like FMN-dependent dehydrogenase
MSPMFLYGLAVNGENGVRTVLENVLADFDLNLGISGTRDVSSFDPI